MPKSQPLLSTVEGLFYLHPSRGLGVQTSEGEVFLQDFLQPGLEVSLSACYTPWKPHRWGVPGLGCCPNFDVCDIHRKDSEFLYSFSGQGVLSWDLQGNLLLGEDVTDLLANMPGHLGWLVCCRKLPLTEPSLDNLVGEVSGMAELLKALKSEIS